MRLASIHVYPLKAARAVNLLAARVEPWGLAGDRRWLVTNLAGGAVSQREDPGLARVVVRYRAPGHDIAVQAPGLPPLEVRAPGPGSPLTRVSVWGARLDAAPAGPAADAWFSRLLGGPARLVYLDDPARRPVDPEFARPGDRVSFADGYPLLLTADGSLAELGRWLAADGHQAVPMTRFRPSVVVSGVTPWAEDDWHRVRIGPAEFRVAKPCGRCVVTTIDQVSGVRGREPLAMLGRRRRFGPQLVFGQNLIPDGTPDGLAGLGVIRVGDPVEVLD